MAFGLAGDSSLVIFLTLGGVRGLTGGFADLTVLVAFLVVFGFAGVAIVRAFWAGTLAFFTGLADFTGFTATGFTLLVGFIVGLAVFLTDALLANTGFAFT